MRLGVVLIFFLALSLACGFRPTMRAKFIRRNCLREIELSNEELEKMRKAILNEDNEMQKCYIKCVLEALNFMDKSGKATPKKGLSTLPPKMVQLLKSAVDVCSSVDGKDPCEKAMKMYRCIQKEFPAITKFL